MTVTKPDILTKAAANERKNKTVYSHRKNEKSSVWNSVS